MNIPNLSAEVQEQLYKALLQTQIDLTTKLNLYENVIKNIETRIGHINPEAYDKGEAHEEAVIDITEMIEDVKLDIFNSIEKTSEIPDII